MENNDVWKQRVKDGRAQVLSPQEIAPKAHFAYSQEQVKETTVFKYLTNTPKSLGDIMNEAKVKDGTYFRFQLRRNAREGKIKVIRYEGVVYFALPSFHL